MALRSRLILFRLLFASIGSRIPSVWLHYGDLSGRAQNHSVSHFEQNLHVSEIRSIPRSLS
jgi:hypothetical protein